MSELDVVHMPGESQARYDSRLADAASREVWHDPHGDRFREYVPPTPKEPTPPLHWVPTAKEVERKPWSEAKRALDAWLIAHTPDRATWLFPDEEAALSDSEKREFAELKRRVKVARIRFFRWLRDNPEHYDWRVAERRQNAITGGR